MSLMDMQRVQILRQRIDRLMKGKSIHDCVGALEAVTADVLTALPGADERSTLSAFDAMAADVRNIIRERFAASGKPN